MAKASATAALDDVDFDEDVGDRGGSAPASLAKPARLAKPVAMEKGAERPKPRGATSGKAKAGIAAVKAAYKADSRNVLLIVTMVEAAAIGLLTLALFVVMGWKSAERPVFFVDQGGHLVQATPLDEPNLTDAALAAWTVMAAVQINTFGYHDFEMRLAQMRELFTAEGWNNFNTALADSGLIDNLRTRQQVVTAAPQGAPILIHRYVERGREISIMQIELLVTYESGDSRDSLRQIIKMSIQRVPTSENPSGIGIKHWEAIRR